MVLVQVFFSLFTEGTLFSFGKKKATLGVKGVHCSEIIKSKSSCYHWMMKRSSNGVRTVCVKQGEMGKRDTGEWAAGGWSWALEGGRYLGCCWNLFPPTGNYRAVSLPVTTAVPGLPADRPWFNTQIPPHTHVSTNARVLSFPLSGGARPFLKSSIEKRFRTLFLQSVVFWSHEQFSDRAPPTMQALLIEK